MATLPQNAVRAIEEFAGSLGLAGKPATDGSFSFRFDNADVFTFTPALEADRVIVSLTFQPARASDQTEAALLLAARYDETSDLQIQTGLASDGAHVLAISVEPDALNLPVIDACLSTLRSARSGIA